VSEPGLEEADGTLVLLGYVIGEGSEGGVKTGLTDGEVDEVRDGADEVRGGVDEVGDRVDEVRDGVDEALDGAVSWLKDAVVVVEGKGETIEGTKVGVVEGKDELLAEIEGSELDDSDLTGKLLTEVEREATGDELLEDVLDND
jgi:hypothetical protein